MTFSANISEIFSKRTSKVLSDYGIKTMDQLLHCSWPELLYLDNMRLAILKEIERKLEELNLMLPQKEVL